MPMRAAVTVTVALLVLAGCGSAPERPGRVAPTAVEALPGHQLACSAQGLQPGTADYAACVRKRGGQAPAAPVAKPGTAARPATSGCRLSPLGGYDCGPS